MNKEKFMQLISDALDKGGYISLNVSQFDQPNDWRPITKQEAHANINEFAEALGINKINTKDKHYSISTGEIYVSCSYAADSYLEEDVDLTGGEEIA